MNSFTLICMAAVAVLLYPGTSGFSTGPPNTICNNSLMPGEAGHGNVSQSGNGGFRLIVPEEMMTNMTNTAGFSFKSFDTYTLMLNSTREGATFEGFVLQATNPGDNPGNQILGEFRNVAQNSIAPTDTQAPNQQLLNCPDGMGVEQSATVTHNNPNRINFTSQMFMWRAPDMDGFVEFRYSIVEERYKFYFNISASTDRANYILVDANGAVIPDPTSAPTSAPTSTPTSPTANTDIVSGRSVASLNEEVNYLNMFGTDKNRHILRIPDGCERASCTTYISIVRKKNDADYLSIYMEGAASAWVAVGFSTTNNMYSADVLACNRNPSNNMIEALDTWNEAFPTRNNVLDSNQDDITLVTGVYVDGRIRCLIRRKIAGSSGEQDVNLNGSYYRLYGVSNNTPLVDSLVTHVGNASPNPTVSRTQVNLFKSLILISGVSGGLRHGCSMLVLLMTVLITLKL